MKLLEYLIDNVNNAIQNEIFYLHTTMFHILLMC